MAKLIFWIDKRIIGEETVDVPNEIIKEGRQAVIDHLYRKGHVDNAIDYGEKRMDLNFDMPDLE